MITQPTDPDTREARAMAQYIAAMARDLKGLAAGAGLPFIAYFLAMVEEDAGTVGRQTEKKRN